MFIKIKVKYLLFILFIVGCATGSDLLRLQDRTLLLDPRSADLIYPYMGKVCKHPERKLFKGCRNKRLIERFPLSDPVVRQKLIAAGFSCKSDMRFKY